MLRLRLIDLKTDTDIDQVLGVCKDDTTRIAQAANIAQRRLINCREAGEEGWYGSWAEVAFTISRDQPYLTTPREISRLEMIDVCQRPIPVQNQFYEYLLFGNGRLPKTRCNPQWPLTAYSRNNVPTFVDLSNPPQLIRVYLTDPQDAGRSVLVQGEDQNDVPVYSQDSAGNRIDGTFVVLTSPFVQTDTPFNKITGIQKDVTFGQVKIYQVDLNTGDEVLLLTMQASEKTAWYRRYYFNALPCNCCGTNQTGPVTVTAMAKLDFIPLVGDTDYCYIQNPEAIVQECNAARYSRMDTPAAKQFEQLHHVNAVRYLNGELNDRLGKHSPAIYFAPFGSARLERQRIGSLM